MRNKTILITGANAGIGYETAKDLLRRGFHRHPRELFSIRCLGARVVLACRNTKKGNEAMRKLLRETNSLAENLRLMECDLASFNSVRSFAKFYNESEERLDVLICNAGVSSASPSISKDGFNTIVQSNYLGHFLLTHLLLDKLKSSRPSRILNVSSNLHRSKPSENENKDFPVHHRFRCSVNRLGRRVDAATSTAMVWCLSNFETLSNSLHVSMEKDFPRRKFDGDERNSNLCADTRVGGDVAERSIGSSGWLDSVSSLVFIDTDDQISLRQNAAQRCGNGDLLRC